MEREDIDETEIDEDEVTERAESILGQQFRTEQAINDVYERKLLLIV
jgi:hypothetical protein